MSWRFGVVRVTCERCGAERYSLGRFGTQRGDDLQIYEGGQRLDPDDSLERGRIHRAHVARYCLPCMREYRCTEIAIIYECVLGWMHEGRLQVPSRSSESLFLQGADYVRRMRMAEGTDWREPLGFHAAVWEGAPAVRLNENWYRFHRELERVASAELVEEGWAPCYAGFRKFPVVVAGNLVRVGRPRPPVAKAHRPARERRMLQGSGGGPLD